MGILLKAQCAERHALIELDSVTDSARFADDDAGAVVDEEARADLAPGWMSMPVLEWATSVIIRGIRGTPT